MFQKLAGASILSFTTLPGLAREDGPAPAFKAKFAPHPGSFPTGPKDYLDQLKFAYDHGFRAWEDNGLAGQSNQLIEQVAAFITDKKMELGVCVISGGSGAKFNAPTDEQKEAIKKDLKRGIEVAKITGQTNMTMVPGARDESISREQQIEASVDFIRSCCDLVESHGIILAQEPLSHGVQGGQPLLRSFADGHLLCSKVARPSCKLLADFYHEGQIGHSDQLIANAEACWDQISYIQYGDVPGRKEPGTGKLDYLAVTQFLRKKNYTGPIGMEHGHSQSGQKGLELLLKAYRTIDA